ncbi:MAG: hypothetical protein IKW04_02430 [Clostridia bacterium]|nr:hypothetical protein [Clostridia bacterium]
MRTDSFSKEKHLPVRRFIADESKVATGLYGPRAIADDLDNLYSMFDPEATFLDGSEQGGISEKNLQNGAVSYEKLAEDVKTKFQGIASEQQLSSLRKELDEKVDSKAKKSTTLSGYGITDAYTKEETEKGFLSKEGFVAEKANLATADMLNHAVREVETSVSKKMEETVLYEDVVNTPVWTKQPTIEGTLDAAFNTTDFYYVTLKDASGNALPSGRFMLKDTYADGATVYPTLFSLANLNTGTATLAENYPVEFTTVGLYYSFRDAGVTLLIQDIDAWNISNGTGSICIVVNGEVIPRNTNLYVYSHLKTDKNVASYHSTNGTTAFQSDSTMDIVLYTNLTELSNVGNMLYDNTVLKKDGSGYFSSERNVVIRYNDKNAKAYQVFGFGKILSENTNIASIAFRLNNVNNGMLRNGTKIIISEVR